MTSRDSFKGLLRGGKDILLIWYGWDDREPYSSSNLYNSVVRVEPPSTLKRSTILYLRLPGSIFEWTLVPCRRPHTPHTDLLHVVVRYHTPVSNLLYTLLSYFSIHTPLPRWYHGTTERGLVSSMENLPNRVTDTRRFLYSEHPRRHFGRGWVEGERNSPTVLSQRVPEVPRLFQTAKDGTKGVRFSSRRLVLWQVGFRRSRGRVPHQ